jgi:hypothetical protein
MKKVKLNASKLLLNKERITELNNEQERKIKGGYYKTIERACITNDNCPSVDCVPLTIGCPAFTVESGCRATIMSACFCED